MKDKVVLFLEDQQLISDLFRNLFQQVLHPSSDESVHFLPDDS